MQKIKTKFNQFISYWKKNGVTIWLLLVINLTIWNIAIYAYFNVYEQFGMITHIQAENVATEQILSQRTPEIEDIVLNMVEDAKLNKYEVWSIINCESHWQADAISINTNGTYDVGLWQINSVHKDINNTDEYSLRMGEAVGYVINMVLGLVIKSKRLKK